MRIICSFLLACAVLIQSKEADAIPITSDPLDRIAWESDRTGQLAFIGRETARYDESADRLSYFASGQGRLHTNYFSPPEDVATNFTSALSWTVGVGETGALTDSGLMLWFGDFGTGFELLASGSVADLGFKGRNQIAGHNTFSTLQLVFDFNYLNPLIAGFGDAMVLSFEQQFTLLDTTPFERDWGCGFGLSMGGPADPFRCSYFSTSTVAGVKVPEPGALSLLLVGLVITGASALRRRRSAIR